MYDAARLIIDSMTINKKRWEAMDEKYGGNSNISVVLLSANTSNVGNINSINQEIYDILGYERKSLINKNITVIMPPIMAHTHNLAISKYFENSQITDKREKLVFAMHSLGYIVPCSLMLKVISNTKTGIQIIGFLNASNNISDVRAGEEKVCK